MTQFAAEKQQRTASRSLVTFGEPAPRAPWNGKSRGGSRARAAVPRRPGVPHPDAASVQPRSLPPARRWTSLHGTSWSRR